MQIAGYTLKERIYEGTKFSIHRAVRMSDNLSCVLKILDKYKADNDSLVHLKSEFELLKSIDSPYVVRAIEYIQGKTHYALALEDIKGKNLKYAFKNHHYSLLDFLKLAIKITEGIANIHKQKIIHKDINPSNIIYNTESDELKIIDLHISTKHTIRTETVTHPDKLEGTLAYIAPEQTGRISKYTDSRSDLYSLGVTFYELLSGNIPFESADQMEMIHAHLAKKPMLLTQHRKDIPAVVAFIVDKLMAKNPDERYQTASGLKYDLELCQQAIMKNESQADFSKIVIGQNDFCSTLHIPERQYGRDVEIKQLSDVFGRSASGSKEIVVISGSQGSGKTKLIDEINAEIINRQAILIKGKFETINQNVPYSAFTQAFVSFVRHIESESNEVLKLWKQNINKAMGELGGVLTELVPDLEQIIGVQNSVVSVDLFDNKQRFEIAIQRFIKAISTENQPLVLFLDDMQYADRASQELIITIAEDESNKYFLLVATTNESSNSVLKIKERLENEHIWLNVIFIDSIDLEAVNNLLKDALRGDKDYYGLAKVIIKKTSGNPYFIIQFINSLYEKELLSFDHERKLWVFKLEQIRSLDITDNVIDLLQGKIKRLKSSVLETLTVASCFGMTFHKKHLMCEACAQETTVEENLDIALGEQVIFPSTGDTYIFAHDNIRKVLYGMLSDQKKRIIHYQIAKGILNHVGDKCNDNCLFDLVNHFNIASDLIQQADERRLVAQLNLSAGKKAKLSAAYDSAYCYLHTAASLLCDNSWRNDYIFTLDVYSEMAEAARLSNHLKAAEKYVDEVLRNAKTPLDKAKVYEIKILDHNSLGKYKEAFEIGIEALKAFGIEFNTNPSKFQLVKTVFMIKLRLQRKCVNDLLELSKMKDERAIAIMKIFAHIGSSVYFVEKKIMLFIAYEQIKMTLNYGISEHSSGAFMMVAMAVAGATHKYDMALKIGDMGMNLLKQHDSSNQRSRLVFLYNNFIHHFKFNIRTTIDKMLSVYHLGYDSGNIEYAEYGLSMYFLLNIITGMPLQQVNNLVKKYHKELDNINNKVQIDNVILFKQLIKVLTKENYNDLSLNSKTDKKDDVSNYEEQCAMPYYYNKLFLNCIFRKCETTNDYIDEFQSLMHHESGTFLFKQQTYLISLARLANIKTRERHERATYLLYLGKDIAHLKHWAKLAPMNHLHQYCLVKAERYRVLGRAKEARLYYDRAIVAARENDFLIDEAFACELAGAFLLQQRLDDFARHYLNDAYDLYLKWGAISKLKQLEDLYPQFINHFNRIKQEKTTTTSYTSSTSRSSVDFGSLIKASQTLSGEMKIEALLGKMMRIVIENSGAAVATLIGPSFLVDKTIKSQELYIIGRATGSKAERINKPLFDAKEVPVDLVNYAVRSGKILVYENFSKESKYAEDSYVKREQPKSVLALPIKHKNEVLGLIYLENNLITGIFTAQRLEVLNMLASQIAISIDNAMLYENLEEKVIQRTQEVVRQKEEIEEKKNEIEIKNTSITDSINYASRIQNAVFPSIKVMQQYLRDVFVLYKPRDIVSGDFYWFKKVAHPTGDKYIIVAADCTGHGVPGAFVSMLGLTFFNEITAHYKEEEVNAAALLEKMRDKVKISLGQDGTDGEQKDGMDLALCIIDPITLQLHFAGAHNPLYIIRKESADFDDIEGIKQMSSKGYQLTQIKADAQPIGIYLRELPFTNNILQLKKNDKLYIFSDGYVDQIGGERMKKYMSKNFKSLLLDIHTETMDKQKQILDKKIEAWKGEIEQIDDILVIGFSV